MGSSAGNPRSFPSAESFVRIQTMGRNSPAETNPSGADRLRLRTTPNGKFVIPQQEESPLLGNLPIPNHLLYHPHRSSLLKLVCPFIINPPHHYRKVVVFPSCPNHTVGSFRVVWWPKILLMCYVIFMN